jgi:hypothetical protein
MKYLFLLVFSLSAFAQNYYLTGPHEVSHIKKYVKFVKFHGRNLIVTPKRPMPKYIQKLMKPIELKDLKRYQPRRVSKRRAHPKILKIIREVDPADVQEIVEKMTSFKNRRSGSDSNVEATKWVAKQFEDMGLKVQVDCFKTKTCNVYAYQKGVETPDEFILVEAHLDDVGHGYAGADDNASGVAGLLSIAKHISALNTKKSFVYFATNGEEQGLYGAKHYVKKFAGTNQLDNIKFVINMDMIGYNKNGKVDIETNNEYESLAKWMAGVAQEYTRLTPNITMPAWGSDHVPFLNKGIDTILTIEHWNTKTPCYHRACDDAESLNYDYAAEIIKLNIASCLLKDAQKFE